MPSLELTVLSLRYSSWSMRPWLALTHADADFRTTTAALQSFDAPLARRRELGSVSGLFPVLRVDSTPIHESLAICEYVADSHPRSRLWPESTLERARARAICAEMVGNFAALRKEMSCHLFARVPDYVPSAAAKTDIDRVLEIWDQALDRSGGPFLFGSFTIADCFYYPVLTRLRTYGVGLPEFAAAYAGALDTLPAIAALLRLARAAPSNKLYDDYIQSLGGDCEAAL